MNSIPNCLKCNSEYTYEDMGLYICPECSYEWTKLDQEKMEEESIIRDAHGTELKDGDDVIIIQDLKVKGSSSPLKQGTKVGNIVLKEGDHNIDCKIPGFGSMELKSEFVKKA